MSSAAYGRFSDDCPECGEYECVCRDDDPTGLDQGIPSTGQEYRELYKQTVTKSADPSITEERPRDVGAPGAVT